MREDTPASVAVRGERAADHRAIREIVTAAFGQKDEADLVDRLRETESPLLSLVAERAGRVMGHVCFSPVWVGDRQFAGLAPVAVAPDRQRRGVGEALIRDGLERCRGLGWNAVFLVGDPAYYSRFGFVLAAPQGFTYGDPHFDQGLQLLELENGAVRDVAGLVRFSPAFAQTGTG